MQSVATKVIWPSARRHTYYVTRRAYHYDPVHLDASGMGGSRPMAKLRYIPAKMKEELIVLHAESPTRWTASALSARFGVPHDNVSALLGLVTRRADRDAAIERLPRETRDTVTDLRARGCDAWQALPETSAPIRSWRHQAPPSKSDTEMELELQAQMKPEPMPAELRDLAEHVSLEEDDHTSKPRSAWATFLDKRCDGLELDVKRNTSFSFIEVGNDAGVTRAVWIREGATGKIRIADAEERKLLLSEVKVRDSDAFL